jgi:branched-chain amino acid transport system substrate-binding protein
MIVRAPMVAGAGAAMAILAAACGGAEKSAPAGGPPARPVASGICSPVSYGGPGRPRFLIVNNYFYQGPYKGHGVQTGQAIKMVLADRGWRAGPYTIGMQACEETSARTGQPSAEKCQRNARAFAQNPSVLGVIGPASSYCAASMLPILNRAPHGPLADISGSNTYVGLTRAAAGTTAPGEPQRYFPTGQRSYARLAPTDDVQGAADAMVAQRLGLRRAFVLDDRSPYGTALAGAFRSAAGSLGVGVVGTGHVSPTAHDYRALAGRVRAAHPTVVFVAGELGNAGPRLIAQLTAVLGPHVRLIGGDAFSPAPLVEAAGPRVDGMILSIAVLPTTSLPPTGRRFAAEFQKRYTQLPCCYSVHDAQATELMLDAIAKAGGNRARIARYLIGARVRDGLLGDFQIDRNGDTTLNTIGIYDIRAGRLRFARAVTPPSELLNRPS